MSRNKSFLAVAALVAIIAFGCQLQAQTIESAIAGSSAQWQTLALGAFGGLQSGSSTQGNCGSLLGATAPCFHYTDKNSSGTSAFALTDSRPTLPNVDPGAIWIVWDSSATPKVWAFIKVDSGVGNRCYFANPACNMGIASVPAPSQAIASALWGNDTALPSSIGNLFTTGTGIPVTVSATDIRPEDSLWSTCRTNSASGMSGFDSTDGLGYNAANPAGVCASYPAGAGGVGSSIKSAFPGSTSTANVVAFALSGKDPITGKTVPKYTTYSVGAAPVVFVFERNGGQLAGLTNVTDAQLQTAFSGTKCDASVFGLSSNPIAVYLREPLSGTMNTTEATVFRYPVGGTLGKSQETGVNGANPLSGGSGGSVACSDDGHTGNGGRWRAIGTGEEVNSVAGSVANNGIDGIGYTFFSYGNVNALSNSSKYGYATLDSVDGIFSVYNNTTGVGFDPGQPANGELPGVANLPSSCSGAFPCPETAIWSFGLSFPNVRSGSYRAWSLLRVVSTGAALTNVEKLIKSSQSYVVTTTPDYIPALKTTASINGKNFTDPGLLLVRSHYQQVDGTGSTDIGGAPANKTGEKGGDMGGCILSPATNTATQLIQQGGSTSYACATRATNP